jgi:DNA-binding transcriptional regulator LsrR (DeoR family)
MPGLTSNVLVGMMSTKYPDAMAFNLPSVPVTSRAEYEAQIKANPELLKIYQDIWQVDIMLLAIGHLAVDKPGFMALAQQELNLTAEQLAAKGVVAEINHTPINAKGEALIDDTDKDLKALTDRIVGVMAPELRKLAAEEGKYLVAVAGGLEKTEAIRACLKGRYFNVLITDAYVAEALVKG